LPVKRDRENCTLVACAAEDVIDIELLERLGHLVWAGDAAQIRASYVRRQKTDQRDAGHILKLLMENRSPRLWTPSVEQRDLRQLLIHRHKLVEIRTRVKNGLQHLALNRGVQKHSRLWSVRGPFFPECVRKGSSAFGGWESFAAALLEAVAVAFNYKM
jgi:hypothetical protein